MRTIFTLRSKIASECGVTFLLLVLKTTLRFFVGVTITLFIGWILYEANTGGNNFFFQIVKITPYGDKVGHVFIFFIATLLINYALGHKTINIYDNNMFLGSLLVGLFATLEETSQLLFPNRATDILDLIGSLFGVTLGTSLAYFIRTRNVTRR